MTAQFFSTTQGMATLTPAGHQIFDVLEDLFLTWASRCGAQPMRYPSLIRVEDLDGLDYFQNFPHLVMCACTLEDGSHQHYSQNKEAVSEIPSTDLRDPRYCLPPAACYNIYLSLRGASLDTAQRFTTVANCFRNENHYRGLERLRGFTMREIVCIGSAESVKAHLNSHRDLLETFMENLGLPVVFEHATDPFFDKNGVSARAGRIFPTKEELVYDGQLAIGSINYHRRFFGKRCEITVDGKTASTGCVAFGIERWMHALANSFGENPERITEAVESARVQTEAILSANERIRAVGS